MAETGSSGRLRVFFALWPDDGVARRLHAAARVVHERCGGRVMQRDTLHMTLAFIGDLPRDRLPLLAAVADDAEGPALTLRLDRHGYWRHNRIVWAGTTTPPVELADFAARFATSLREAGFAIERRPFAPHVTLLRNARCKGTPPAAEPVLWPVDRFVLVASSLTPQGSRYRILADWPLHK